MDSPSKIQLLHGGDPMQTLWSSPMTTPSHGHDHHYHHDHDDHHHKKSVLAKVKEKARRWRNTILKKKHGHEEDGITTPPSMLMATPPSMFMARPTATHRLDEVDEGKEQDPEYHGAPMYESETAPTMYKEEAAASSPRTPSSVLDHHPASNIKQRSVLSPRTPSSVLDHHPASNIKQMSVLSPKTTSSVLDHHPESNIKQRSVISPKTPNSTVHHQDTQQEPKLHHLDSFKETSLQHNLVAAPTSHTLVTETKAKEEEDHNSNKTLTETVTEILAPAYNVVSDATHKIAAKIHSPMARDHELGAKQMWDKGVSMKEYLLHKLEPGEDEKALSAVITEAISPRKAGRGHGEEISVVDKVRGAVSSLLGKEEQMGPTRGASRPLFKVTHGPSILETKDCQESLIPTMNYTHGKSIPPPKYTQEAKTTFSEDGQEDLNKASDETLLPPFKGIHGVLSSTSTDTHGDSIPSSVYIDVAESKRVHGASVLAPEYSHGVSVTDSKGNQEVSMQASEYLPESSIQGSRYGHGPSVRDSMHAYGDTSPLPVSTYPSSVRTSTNTSTSTNPSMINVSPNPLSRNPHTVEETRRRILQAYTN